MRNIMYTVFVKGIKKFVGGLLEMGIRGSAVMKTETAVSNAVSSYAAVAVPRKSRSSTQTSLDLDMLRDADGQPVLFVPKHDKYNIKNVVRYRSMLTASSCDIVTDFDMENR